MSGEAEVSQKMLTDTYNLLKSRDEMRGVFTVKDGDVWLPILPPWIDDTGWEPRAFKISDIDDVRKWIEKHGLNPHRGQTMEAIRMIAVDCS